MSSTFIPVIPASHRREQVAFDWKIALMEDVAAYAAHAAHLGDPPAC